MHDFNLKILVNKTPLGCKSSSEALPDSESVEHDSGHHNTGQTVHRVLAIGLRQPIKLEPQSGEIVFACPLDEDSTALDNTVSQVDERIVKFY